MIHSNFLSNVSINGQPDETQGPRLGLAHFQWESPQATIAQKVALCITFRLSVGLLGRWRECEHCLASSLKSSGLWLLSFQDTKLLSLPMRSLVAQALATGNWSCCWCAP